MGVRNESAIIEQSLRALALYTDAIVILDDASEDIRVIVFILIGCIYGEVVITIGIIIPKKKR